MRPAPLIFLFFSPSSILKSKSYLKALNTRLSRFRSYIILSVTRFVSWLYVIFFFLFSFFYFSYASLSLRRSFSFLFRFPSRTLRAKTAKESMYLRFVYTPGFSGRLSLFLFSRQSISICLAKNFPRSKFHFVSRLSDAGNVWTRNERRTRRGRRENQSQYLTAVLKFQFIVRLFSSTIYIVRYFSKRKSILFSFTFPPSPFTLLFTDFAIRVLSD